MFRPHNTSEFMRKDCYMRATTTAWLCGRALDEPAAAMTQPGRSALHCQNLLHPHPTNTKAGDSAYCLEIGQRNPQTSPLHITSHYTKDGNRKCRSQQEPSTA